MMKLALLATALTHEGFDRCPSSLVAHGYAPGAAAHSRAYTDCMTIPSLPAADELSPRLEKCAPLRARAVRRARAELRGAGDYRLYYAHAAREAEGPFGWVDHIASNFPGCETRMYVAGDGRRPPHVD